MTNLLYRENTMKKALILVALIVGSAAVKADEPKPATPVTPAKSFVARNVIGFGTLIGGIPLMKDVPEPIRNMCGTIAAACFLYRSAEKCGANTTRAFRSKNALSSDTLDAVCSLSAAIFIGASLVKAVQKYRTAAVA